MHAESNLDVVEYVRNNDGELPPSVKLPSEELIVKILSSAPYANGESGLPWAVEQTLLLYGCFISGMVIYLGLFWAFVMLIT